MASSADPGPACRGTGYLLFAFDVGQAIDLGGARRAVAASAQRVPLKHRHKAPTHFQFDPAPVGVVLEAEPIPVGTRATAPTVEALLFDFGAVSLTYAVPFEGPLAELGTIGSAVAPDGPVAADARLRLDTLLARLGRTVQGRQVAPLVEDYVIFHLHPPADGDALGRFVDAHAQELARLLRAETEPLSADEVADALASRIQFGPDDLTLLDWSGAIVFDDEQETDLRAVLEFANVQLLELRLLDATLDRDLDRAYEALKRRGLRLGRFKELRRVGRLQVDAALLCERVRNALKLLGDQFLARLYRLAAARLHLAAWDASIQRKLDTLGSIQQMLSDRATNRRIELLEWMIVLLIALEIVLSFVR